VGIYLIADAGLRFGGLENARRLIRAAKDAGADAVGFHSLHAKTLAHPMFAADQRGQLAAAELSREDHFELAAACQDAGIDFLATAYDSQAVDLLCELQVPAIRIDSGDATNLPLIAYTAKQEQTLYIATGMCSLAEAADAYYCAIEEGAPRVVLLHTTCAYPTPLAEANLAAIGTLAGELFCEVGYSDNTAEPDCCIVATALNATVIEKGLRLEGSADDPWAVSACSPAEFERLATRLRLVEQALGDGEKRLTAGETTLAETARRSVFYSRDLPAGSVITWNDLAFLRPVIGLSPAEAYRFVGRTLGVDMQAGELASEQDIAIVELKRPASGD